MNEELDLAQIDQNLDATGDRIEQLFQEAKIRSALQMAREMTRQAKGHGRVVQYMRALFDQMRLGHGMLEPQVTADAAVELIALLNDEEHARRIQPDLHEGYYQWTCQWMSSCAYDNLAESTGDMHGYNSTGMHECIADGIQVCRQTGKMECVKCFREYAADVYLASDDLEMVQHQCQVLLEYRGPEIDRKDRRWTGHKKQAWLRVLNGDITGAIAEYEQARVLSQAEDVYLKLQSLATVLAGLDETLLLAGESRYDWSSPAPMTPWVPEPGEWPVFEFERACGDSLAAFVGGKPEEAIRLLTEWDQRLTKQKNIRQWFEARLRLIALYLLSDKQTRAEALARGLEAQATESQDFLTLRRLKRLLDPAIPVVPIPTLQPVTSGPFAAISAAVPQTPIAGPQADSAEAEEPAAASGDNAEEEITPLKGVIEELMGRILEARQIESEAAAEQRLSELLSELLTHNPESIEHPRDGATLLHISRWVLTGPDDARRVWAFGLALVERFPQDATALNVLADLGAHFRSVDPDAFDDVEEEELEKMFRKSLALNSELPRNFLRAGDYFAQKENLGEAERCYARAFRLDRTEGTAAMNLANVYRETDRPRDALAALDLCLREGSENADVAWEAALAAFTLDQYDSQLTYLERHLELGEPHAWVEYYRAWALLQLQRYDECLAAVHAERQFDPPGDYHLQVLTACALAGKGDHTRASEAIQHLLEMRLVDVDYLSMNGISRNLNRLCFAVAEWPADDPIRVALMQRMLETGLMPDAYFEELREHEPEEKEVNFYRVRVNQPTGENWRAHAGCLPGQTEWTGYNIEYGVLAKTEEEAGQRVLAVHHSGLDDPAEVIDVEIAGENFEDRPGVVWQGFRWSDTEIPDDDLFDISGDEEDEL